jgi:hypothetical protein
MIGEGHAIADGALLIAVLAARNYLLDVTTCHLPFFALFNQLG